MPRDRDHVAGIARGVEGLGLERHRVRTIRAYLRRDEDVLEWRSRVIDAGGDVFSHELESSDVRSQRAIRVLGYRSDVVTGSFDERRAWTHRLFVCPSELEREDRRIRVVRVELTVVIGQCVAVRVLHSGQRHVVSGSSLERCVDRERQDRSSVVEREVRLRHEILTRASFDEGHADAGALNSLVEVDLESGIGRNRQRACRDRLDDLRPGVVGGDEGRSAIRREPESTPVTDSAGNEDAVKPLAGEILRRAQRHQMCPIGL